METKISCMHKVSFQGICTWCMCVVEILEIIGATASEKQDQFSLRRRRFPNISFYAAWFDIWIYFLKIVRLLQTDSWYAWLVYVKVD